MFAASLLAWDGAIETVAKSVEAGGSLRMLYKRE
jgi:hypothetical protein